MLGSPYCQPGFVPTPGAPWFGDTGRLAPRIGSTSTPSRARHGQADRAAVSAVAASSGVAAGLVSVPTSRTPTKEPAFSGPIAASNAAAAGDGLVRELGAFQMDREGRRLASLRCAVGVAARCLAVADKGHRERRAWMLTLTYAGDNSAWRSHHLKDAMMRLRKWCNRQGFACQYVWVAELQKRGVIHYHAVVYLPVGVRLPAFDSRGWWPHGMTNRKVVRRSAVGYLMKYLSKGTDVSIGAFPRGARLYGVAGLDQAMRRARRWYRLPAFVQGNSSTLDAWDRRLGGGWLSPDGECFASEFQPVMVGGRRCLVRVAKHERRIDASGAFSWLIDRAASLALVH